ncbi:hypothetical protein RHSIM_Rhsim11G0090000 [Rhododendron simsii]|uniref:Zinc finger GRF-type domain-containing protein n=1 Tax=Rhododendron simsii TaxID=118357 RepID=A0A834GAP5_RHOSS|nr:hypothetical protein RHSIM_Rhsim11G0090000 [Rhododendron simsii]
MEGTHLSDNGRDDPDFGISYFCGEPSPLRKSTIQKNPSRRFFSYSKYKETKKDCGFFCWYEPSIWQERSYLGPMKVQTNAKDLTTVEEQQCESLGSMNISEEIEMKIEAMQKEIQELYARKEFRNEGKMD